LYAPKTLAVAATFAATLSTAAAQPPTPKWGGATEFFVTVTINCPADSPSPEFDTWEFDYFYSANHGDLYHHKEMNGDEICGSASNILKVGEPCNVLNSNTDGRSYVWSPGDAEKCCAFPMHLGMIKPDWLEASNATYAGDVAFDDGEGTFDHWVAEGAYTNNYACLQDGSEAPVRFWENKAEGPTGLKQWDFQLDTYRVEAQDKKLFTPPQNCRRICRK